VDLVEQLALRIHKRLKARLAKRRQLAGIERKRKGFFGSGMGMSVGVSLNRDTPP
jgi:hypothetical protein